MLWPWLAREVTIKRSCRNMVDMISESDLNSRSLQHLINRACILVRVIKLMQCISSGCSAIKAYQVRLECIAYQPNSEVVA